jgi:hypothetical protein
VGGAADLVGIARHQHHAQFGMQGQAPFDQGDAVEARHLHICDEHIEAHTHRLQLLQRLGPVLRGGHVVSVEAQCALHQVPRCRVIVGEKDACHVGLRPNRTTRARGLARRGATSLAAT